MTKYKVIVPGGAVVARDRDRAVCEYIAAALRGARVVAYRV